MLGNAVLLVAEVSQGTLRDDLGAKKAAYARAGVPEYWVFDVDGRKAHRFMEPCDGDYREAIVFGFEDVLETRSPRPLQFPIQP
jgi:Uma2 family endonuclease